MVIHTVAATKFFAAVSVFSIVNTLNLDSP